MAWTKKASAPAFVNLASELGTLITGTPDAWLLGWLHLLGDPVLDVAALCALGPETCAPIEGADFIGFLSRGKIIPGSTAALVLGPKLACFARNRLFAAYCEQPGPAPGTFGPPVCVNVPVQVGGTPGTATIALPTGTTRVQVYVSSWGSSGSPFVDELQCWFAHADGVAVVPRIGHWQGTEPPSGTFIGIKQPLDTMIRINNYHTLKTAVMCAQFDGAPGAPWDAPTIVQPPEAKLPPPAGSTTIPGLSAQLDAIENKLGWILEGTTAQLIEAIEPMVSAGPPVDVAADDEIALDDEVIGAIVLLADVGPQTDMFFGEPPNLRHVARLLIGNANGWLAPIDIQVSPLIVTGIPAGMTVAKVSCDPPATASIQLLKRASPAG